MSEILNAIEVHKKYESGDEELHVLQGINLDIREGKKVVIVGESGAGKSTLLNLLSTMDSVTRGKVLFKGKDITQLSENQAARLRNLSFGFIFQFYYLIPELTALENVMIPGMLANNGSAVKERALELLEVVGLSDRMNHKPAQLSGGEQQRVTIARALINDPDCIFADEPTGSLDSKNSETVMELLFALTERSEKILVMVTHNYKLTGGFDDRYEIKNGILNNING